MSKITISDSACSEEDGKGKDKPKSAKERMEELRKAFVEPVMVMIHCDKLPVGLLGYIHEVEEGTPQNPTRIVAAYLDSGTKGIERVRLVKNADQDEFTIL